MFRSATGFSGIVSSWRFSLLSSQNDPASTSCSPNADAILGQYLCFLKTYQGLADATLVLRRLHVGPFLRAIEKSGDLANLRVLAPSVVHDYIIAISKPLTRASRKHLVSGLRSFLRFAHVNGLVERSLVEAVPVILTRKLDRLPHTIPWEDVQKLLATPDRATLVGNRDYAVLRLIASYGLRIGQAIHLRVRDIDWHKGLIHFPAEKGCKALSFPILEEVAEALLSYLRARGEAPGMAEVFLTVRGLQRPLDINNHMGSALQSYYRRAGVQSSRLGAHPIRHAFATRLMEKGTPIKDIADLLGHRSIETTFLYTKVELERLRTLAAEWPEVQQ
jgi:integrase/recombinase XerD